MTRHSTPAVLQPRASQRGFTLVEVLVAMVIMAIMAVMAWQGVDGIVRTRDASQAKLEQTLRLNTVIAQWDQDIASIQDTAVVPLALSCDGATVRLTRHTPDGLQVVAWSLRPDTGNGGGSWVRWAGPSVTTTGELADSWLRSLQLQGAETGSLRTLTGVTDWQVYYYQGTAWANCQSTGNVATPTVSASGVVTRRQELPKGVRIVLSFAPESGINGELTRDTLVLP
jgi:general secretion pathway protein J